MYLDIGNMKSYNKSHGCEQPYVTCTLIPSPPECELYIYIYLLNTERSSSGVRINDLAISLRCATFLKYWFVTTRERSFPVRLDRGI